MPGGYVDGESHRLYETLQISRYGPSRSHEDKESIPISTTDVRTTISNPSLGLSMSEMDDMYSDNSHISTRQTNTNL